MVPTGYFVSRCLFELEFYVTWEEVDYFVFCELTYLGELWEDCQQPIVEVNSCLIAGGHKGVDASVILGRCVVIDE